MVSFRWPGTIQESLGQQFMCSHCILFVTVILSLSCDGDGDGRLDGAHNAAVGTACVLDLDAP
eukprot:803571-Amphidinium_carterae.1